MALTCHSLQIGYGRKALCDPATLSFAPGLHALVGRNGTGKSTFLRTIALLSSPLSGDVRWRNRSLMELTVMERAQVVSWLPAEESIPFAYAVEDILLMGRHPWHGGRPLPADHARAKSVLVALDMTALSRRPVDQLSTGERQLVRLGRALMSDAPVWLWDEPLRGLDCHHQIMVLRLLRAAADEGRTVLVALHELEWAQRLADDFLVFGASNAPLGPLSPGAFAAPELWRDAFFLESALRREGERTVLDIKFPY